MERAGIPENRHAGKTRRCVLQQFEALAGELRTRIVCYASDVAAWMSEARDQSELQWLPCSGHDNRDRRRCLLRDHDRRRSDRHDDVDAAGDEILRLPREAIPVGIREAAFDHDIATLDVAELRKALLEWSQGPRGRGRRWCCAPSNQPMCATFACASTARGVASTPPMSVPRKARRVITGSPLTRVAAAMAKRQARACTSLFGA